MRATERTKEGATAAAAAGKKEETNYETMIHFRGSRRVRYAYLIPWIRRRAQGCMLISADISGRRQGCSNLEDDGISFLGVETMRGVIRNMWTVNY